MKTTLAIFGNSAGMVKTGRHGHTRTSISSGSALAVCSVEVIITCHLPVVHFLHKRNVLKIDIKIARLPSYHLIIIYGVSLASWYNPM